jgi:RNA polymerase sigma factor (sigma-70 family)
LADSGNPGATPGEEEVRRRLRNFALRLTGDPHQAEDVAQETLARVLVPGTPRDLPYQFSIALNLVRSDARRAARRRPAPKPVEQVADPRSMDPLSRLVAEEERTRFWSAVGRIPEKERHALLLRFSEEYEG